MGGDNRGECLHRVDGSDEGRKVECSREEVGVGECSGGMDTLPKKLAQYIKKNSTMDHNLPVLGRLIRRMPALRWQQHPHASPSGPERSHPGLPP